MEESIERAKQRIKELETLIKHWQEKEENSDNILHEKISSN
tara:strand:- start:8 stop:130 length:123 start_codon:yes stop_codon:yes gene_type:complete